MDIAKATEIAEKINASGATDTFGAKLVANVWEGPRGCRVYVRTDSRKRRELGYVDDTGYTGKSGKAVRAAIGGAA